MRAHFFLIPLAAAGIVQPTNAAVYLTVEQAQALMFPGATFTVDFRTLSDEEAAAIERASDTNVLGRQLKVWRVSTGGWFLVDEVLGKHEYIPFALGIDATGAVTDIEILEYREAYGSQIVNPKWRAQFVGKNRAAALRLTDDIQNISGATLSSKHVTDGVRRLVATYALVLAAH